MYTENEKVEVVYLDEMHNQIIKLVDEGKIEEALQLSEKLNHKLQNMSTKESSKQEEDIKDVTNKQEFDENKQNKQDLLTKIYCNAISLNEIELSNIEEFDKVLLTIAFYEKNNKKKGIEFIKNKKLSYEKGLKLKTLNILLERLMNKKNRIFDPIIYEKYLNCYINYDLIIKIKNEQANAQIVEKTYIPKKEEFKQPKQDEPIIKQKSNNKIIISQGKRISSRKSIYNNGEKQISVHKKEILIKDLFEEEITEIGKYIYSTMSNLSLQKKAIEAWDKLECLANQPVSNKDKLRRMISLIDRLKDIDDINLSVDEKKYSKYL